MSDFDSDWPKELTEAELHLGLRETTVEVIRLERNLRAARAQRWQVVVELIQERDVSVSEVARTMQVTPTAIRREMRRQGLPPARHRVGTRRA